MKKTQILGVIALAFALGVVAPVASVSAFEVKTQEYATDTATGLSTCDEVKKAFEAVTTDQNYLNVKDLSEATAKYGTDYADISVDAYNDLRTHFVTSKPTLAGGSATTATVRAMQADINNAVNSAASAVADASNIESTRVLLDAAKSLPNYIEFVNLINAWNNPSDTVTLHNAVVAFRANVLNADGIAVNPGTVDTDYSLANIDAYYGTGLTTYYQNVASAVDAVSAQYDKAVDGKAVFAGILGRSGVLAAGTDGVDAFNAANVDTNATVVATLNALASQALQGSTAKPTVSAINFNWVRFYTLLNTKTVDTVCLATDTDNFDLVWGWAQMYKAATDQMDKDTKVIAEELVKYTAPIDPTDPSDPSDPSGPSTVPDDTTKPSTPSVDGNGNGSVDAGASFGTPDTGVVTKSEGSASASVAIMAAISTVVAGLGAAIVAIRNFKRNKNA